MRSLLHFSLLVCCSSALATVQNPVDLGYVKYQGKRNDTLGITAYYSLKYAVPPTGNLRWRSPSPIEDSIIYTTKPLINASIPQFECYQTVPTWQKLITQQIATGQIKANISAITSVLNFGQISSVQNEDCLTLDVVVPNRPKSSQLPVVVYIHGGGYTEGNSAMSDGSEFVSFSDGKLIYVAIQYRLGALGFLSGKDVKADGTANAGLLDQRLALEWTQKHIGAFGGDPNRVTIWGGSAGGGSVSNQMILYGGSKDPPFHAAIPEYPWWQPFHDDTLLEVQYQSLLQASNCTDLQCLRNLSSEAMSTAATTATDADYTSGRFGYGDFWWGPSVDGSIIQDLPSREYAAGHFAHVPVMTDRDGFEGFIFTNFSLSTIEEVQEDLSQLWPNTDMSGPSHGTSFFQHLYSLYPASDFGGSFYNQSIFAFYFNSIPSLANDSAYWQRQTIFGDYIINCPTFAISKAQAKAGQNVYKMIFAAGTQIHSSDTPYLFGASNDTDNPKLADTIKDYFVGFVTKSNPNANRKIQKPEWPRYTHSACRASSNRVLRMEDQRIFTQRDPDASEKCDLFLSHPHLVRN